jgi:aspartyl-tRNA(Asn)/glutamyl-tRNA(Gln) amidotransferase subunit B
MAKSYEPVIGLEIHVQLKTVSKMFCSSSAAYFGSPPNSHVCPTCLGLPGALPVANKVAIENAVKVGLSLNCTINKENKFDRKSYFYPDLPKGYQISQFDQPINVDGWVKVSENKIRINRAHLEEDTGKLIHANVDQQPVSLIDFNRSSVPLLEIVSEPDIRSASEAKAYAKKIHQICRYIGVADVDMEKAGMRFDANVSLREVGTKEFGTKVEIKNINSFNFLERAIVFEIERQKKELEKGNKIIQETRGWVESRGETVSQRTKETSPDYRYFPDPDLPPLELSDEVIKQLKAQLPELPDQKIERFQKDYSLGFSEATQLSDTKELAEWFEKALNDLTSFDKPKNDQKDFPAKKVANWVLGPLRAYLNENGVEISEVKAEPASLAELILLVEKGEVSNQAAKTVFSKMLETGQMPAKIITELGLKQVSDESELEGLVAQVLEENADAVKDYRSGKESSLQFLLGQVMRKSKGSANPSSIRELLLKKLK